LGEGGIAVCGRSVGLRTGVALRWFEIGDVI
jgi:hypothetical protein